MKKIISTILALAACTTLTAQDFKITHGPWLCDLTSDGVTVVWATSKPALSWVEVAEDDGRSFYAAQRHQGIVWKAGRRRSGAGRAEHTAVLIGNGAGFVGGVENQNGVR